MNFDNLRLHNPEMLIQVGYSDEKSPINFLWNLSKTVRVVCPHTVGEEAQLDVDVFTFAEQPTLDEVMNACWEWVRYSFLPTWAALNN